MATNSPNLISLPSARPETGVVYPANDSQIASAISRAQENLLGQQKPDGHWCGELYVDSTLCSDYVLYLHWLGDERGNHIPRELAISPMCIEIGAQVLHAAGFAWAFKLRKEKRVVQCFMGDGATSTGDFHEGLNFAATYRLPCVFTCVNNGWAISVPTTKQTASETFAQKGLAYGMPCVQVDGNDIFAVYKAHKQAVNRAREGLGPSFIEAITYRMKDHTTADDARRYRPGDELEVWSKKDPLHRTRKYLEARGLWNTQEQTRADERVRAQAQEIIRKAVDVEPPTNTDVFDHVFAETPCQLRKQRDTMRTDSIG
jgi:pyruvate dehydrogenase E1 component alpha subunit